MALPTTIQIPTPSLEEMKLLAEHEVSAFSYIDKTVRVYVRFAEEVSHILGGEQSDDALLFCVDDVWFIQTHSVHEDTIEASLASLFHVQPWQVVGHAPVLMTRQDDAWRGVVITSNLFYKGVFSLYANWHNDSGGQVKARLEFALEIRRDFRCEVERADKMGYEGTKYRKIREVLFKKEDTKLYLSYEDYLYHYRQVLPEKGNETWARLRNYFRDKAVRAAVVENITEMDPILHTELAMKDCEDAKQPIGGLDEDWFTYGE